MAVSDGGGVREAGLLDTPADGAHDAAGRNERGGDIRRYYRTIAPFLDQELAERGDGALWSWAASRRPGGRVLELGCGTGRATAFLAESAASVVALDLSLDLLARARLRLAGRRNVALLCADMRRLALRRRFDLVVAVDDPFVHLTTGADRDRAIRAAARHLAPGGRLILDTAWFPPRQRRRAAGPGGLVIERTLGGQLGAARQRLQVQTHVGGATKPRRPAQAHVGVAREPRRPGSAEDSLTVREHWRCAPGSRLCTARFSYERGGAILADSSFRARLWSMAELESRLRAARLVPLSLWGDYDRRPWRRATSPRLIVEACAAAT